MELEEEKIREIECEIDKLQSSREVWHEDRSKLIYNALVCFEDMCRLMMPYSIFKGESPDALVNSNADAIDMLIKWIYKYSKDTDGGFVKVICEGLYIELSFLLVDDTKKYRAICDSYILWSRKKSKAELYSNGKGVKFNYLEGSDGKYEIYDLLRMDSKKNNCLKDFNINEDFINEISNLELTNDNNNLKYTLSDMAWNYIHNEMKRMIESTSELPQEWQFDGFKLEEFKEVWGVLVTKAFIHCMVCMKSGIAGGAVECCIMVVTKEEIIDEVSKYTNLDCEVIENTINLLTYNNTYYERNIDVIWSPLISLKDNLIAISPNLVMSSSPERNVISLINKVNQATYSRLSSQKESIMLRDFVDEISKYTNIDIRNNKPLPAPLPDIDVIMFDKNTESLLMCELKWLLQSDSIQEVCERDKDIEKGISQAKLIQEYTLANTADVLNRCYGKNEYKPKKIYSCIVTRNNIGTSKLGKDMKVIDEKRLYEMFIANNGDISIIIDRIDSEEFIGIIEDNYKVIQQEIEYGGYKFKFDTVKVVNNEDNLKIVNTYKKRKNIKSKRAMSKDSRRRNR